MRAGNIRLSVATIMLLACWSGGLQIAEAADLTVDTATVTRVFTVLGPPTTTTNPDPTRLAGSLTNGLLAFWPLNEMSGSVAADTSGNTNNGTIGAGVSLNQSMGTITGMSFDGSSGKIVCPAVIPSGSAAKSVSAWFVCTNNANGVPVGLSSFGGCSQNWRILTIPAYDTVNIDDGCNFAELDFVNLSTIHHIVGTYDGSTVALYFDGSLQATTENTLDTSSSDLWIGNDSDNNYFAGQIAQVGVWNRALTSDEVTALYNNLSSITLNNLFQAAGTNVHIMGQTLIDSLVRQGDIDMGSFTNKP